MGNIAVPSTTPTATIDGRAHRVIARLRRPQALAALALAAVVMMLLTACGAVIDTVMTVNDDGSGTRVMVATLSGEDAADLVGGSAAADASIRRNLPSELTYSGLAPTGDGGLAATFTLTFDSTTDYTTKVTSLLAASQSTGASTSEFSVSDSTLVTGIDLSEGFSSGDLLTWMFTGLAADGVVGGDVTLSDMYEIGTTSVAFGGQTVDGVGSRIQYSDVQNNGFDDVSMQTRIDGQSDITRTITYVLDDERIAQSTPLVTTFFDESTPDGATLDTPSSGTWTMTFSGAPDDIEKATSTALGGAPATFDLELGPVQGDPTVKQLDVTDTADCSAVCGGSGAGSALIVDKLDAGESYQPRTVELDTSATMPTSFLYSPPLTSVASSFDFGLTGGVTATIEFVVPQSSVDAVGDGFATRYRPDEKVGSFDTSKGSDSTTYTVSITGGDVQSFSERYRSWAGAASIAQGPLEKAGIFSQRSVYEIDPGIAAFTVDHEVTDGSTVEVRLPFGQFASDATGSGETHAGITGQTVTFDGADGRVSLTTRGLTLAGMIGTALLLAALVVGVVLVVRRRTAVVAGLRGLRERVDGVAGQTRASLTDMVDRGGFAAAGAPSATASAADRGSVLTMPTLAGTAAARPGALAVTGMDAGSAPYAGRGALDLAVPTLPVPPRPSLFSDSAPRARPTATSGLLGWADTARAHDSSTHHSIHDSSPTHSREN